MKQIGFLEGVGVALVASIGGGTLFTMLTTFFAGGFALRLLIAVVGLIYVLYLLHRSGEKVGRLTFFIVWLTVAITSWLAGLSLPLFILTHLSLAWLTRSLYYYSSLISALIDLGLVLLGFAAAAWAILETGNVFLSLWSFFLVQALFALIPPAWQHSNKSKKKSIVEVDRFQHAYRTAEAAINKLSTAR